MQIQNNYQTQNFGMAFRINGVKGEEAVRNMSAQMLDNMTQIAEEMKPLKHIDYIIGEHGSYGIELKKVGKIGCKYTDFKFNEAPLTRTFRVGATNVGGCANHGQQTVLELDFANPTELTEFCETIKTLPYEKKVAEVAKFLNTQAAKEAAEKAATAAAEEARKAKADSLIGQYSKIVTI